MICFDVSVNKERVCLAGKEEMLVMNCIVDYIRASEGRDTDEVRLSVGGLFEHSGARIHPRWTDQLDLKVGDEITIRIVESDTADEPSAEVAYTAQEDEQQERRYFEKLKTKFEKSEKSSK